MRVFPISRWKSPLLRRTVICVSFVPMVVLAVLIGATKGAIHDVDDLWRGMKIAWAGAVT